MRRQFILQVPQKTPETAKLCNQGRVVILCVLCFALLTLPGKTLSVLLHLSSVALYHWFSVVLHLIHAWSKKKQDVEVHILIQAQSRREDNGRSNTLLTLLPWTLWRVTDCFAQLPFAAEDWPLKCTMNMRIRLWSTIKYGCSADWDRSSTPDHLVTWKWSTVHGLEKLLWLLSMEKHFFPEFENHIHSNIPVPAKIHSCTSGKMSSLSLSVFLL